MKLLTPHSSQLMAPSRNGLQDTLGWVLGSGTPHNPPVSLQLLQWGSLLLLGFAAISPSLLGKGANERSRGSRGSSGDRAVPRQLASWGCFYLSAAKAAAGREVASA